MPRYVPDDLDIIVGETERRRLRGTTEPRTTYRLLNRNALHMPELYQALGRGWRRHGVVAHDTSGPFGAERGRSDDRLGAGYHALEPPSGE